MAIYQPIIESVSPGLEEADARLFGSLVMFVVSHPRQGAALLRDELQQATIAPSRRESELGESYAESPERIAFALGKQAVEQQLANKIQPSELAQTVLDKATPAEAFREARRIWQRDPSDPDKYRQMQAARLSELVIFSAFRVAQQEQAKTKILMRPAI